ncbi:3-phosphoshikimate 1-carboxyvinyltransferase, partial [Vibrio parahaemolyticus]|nr:3-phosphoshikimate 1-carboxyvinyltransferase [Vibrio parahaemolyticus]
NLPGSKSVANRALLLAALAKGRTRLTNLLDSDDIRHMLNALTKLGVQYQLSEDKTECLVDGLGRPFSVSEPVELFLGNAGTAMRPLAAALCLGEGEYVLTGEPRMKERPIGHLVTALKDAGANVEYMENENFPPLKIIGTGLKAGTVSIDGSISSQFLTAFLMSAPLAEGEIRINIEGDLVSKPYIDITLHIMKQFGVDVINNDYQEFVI